MVRKILRTPAPSRVPTQKGTLEGKPRPRVVIRYKRPKTSPPILTGMPPWHGQRVRLEDLPAFRARWGLIVVGGDPDLDAPAGSWAPKVYLVEG